MATGQRRWMVAVALALVAMAGYAGVIIRIGMDSP